MEAAAANDLLRALVALLALLALPGLTVVRAPWTAVPFLSLSFWLVTWPWLDALHATRTPFVVGALCFFALLALLRLPRLPRARPGRSTTLIIAASVAALLPLACIALPVGDEGPLRALTVRLLVWRDGLPRTYEPLLPVHVFGADRHAVDLLAADVALLGGVTPALATLVASLAAMGALVVALDALLVRLGRGREGAAITALLMTGALGLASGTQAPGAATPSTLGLALGVSGGALLLRGVARAPAVAAGLMLGAACAAEPWLMALMAPLAGAPAATRLLWLRAAARRVEAVRLGWALGGLLLVTSPAWARFDGPHVPWTRLAFTGAHGFALATVVASVIASYLLPRALPRTSLPLAAACALGGSLYAAWQLAPRLPPSRDDVRAFQAVARRTTVTDAICGEPDSADVWMPALVGRARLPAAAWPSAYVAPGAGPGQCLARGASARLQQRPQVVAKP